MAQTAEAPVVTTEDWTYLGYQNQDDGKLVSTWETPKGSYMSFKRPITRHAQPGAIYAITFECSANHTISVRTRGEHTPVYKGMVENIERLAILQAASRSAEAEARMVQKAKADMSRDALGEILAPLRNEYHRRNRTGRVALIATIIELMQVR